MKKSKSGLLYYTSHTNKHKMDYRLKYKTWNDKSPRRKHKENIHNICVNNDFLELATKGKIDVGLHETENLHRKETINRVKR